MSTENAMLYSMEDHELISNLSISYNKTGYAVAIVDGKSCRIHRLIMNPSKMEIVDHINGNKLDNRRENLRITDSQGNAENKKKQKNTSSLYKGVSLIKKTGKYRSKITFKKRSIHLGTFSTEQEAAEAYDLYIVHHSPSLFFLNFPEKHEKYLSMKEKGTILTEYTGIKRSEDMYVSNLGDCSLKFKSSFDAAIYRDNFIVKNNKKGALNFPNDHFAFLNKKTKVLYEDIEADDTIIRLIIPTSPDCYVTINKVDYNRIKHYSLYIYRGYVHATNQTKVKLLNRIIMNEKDPNIYIDHIDRNTMNNTKSNLRRSDALKNSQNKSKNKKNATSKYVGVSFAKTKNKWMSRINVEGKSKFIGAFDTEQNAVIARDVYILRELPNSHFPLSGVYLPKDFQFKNKKITSKHIGVHFDKRKDKWMSNIQINGKRKHIGGFKSEDEAAIARDMYILKNNHDTKKRKSSLNL